MIKGVIGLDLEMNIDGHVVVLKIPVIKRKEIVIVTLNVKTISNVASTIVMR